MPTAASPQIVQATPEQQAPAIAMLNLLPLCVVGATSPCCSPVGSGCVELCWRRPCGVSLATRGARSRGPVHFERKKKTQVRSIDRNARLLALYSEKIGNHFSGQEIPLTRGNYNTVKRTFLWPSVVAALPPAVVLGFRFASLYLFCALQQGPSRAWTNSHQ